MVGAEMNHAQGRTYLVGTNTDLQVPDHFTLQPLELGPLVGLL